ncbi:MAG: hypothetical protein EBV06_15545 [Planctomycetia bacterium]|nr:hypothetical protein [Planctomycetia bacterium]
MRFAAGLCTVLLLVPVVWAAGPIDTPTSTEPRVALATSKSQVGLVGSEGVGKSYSRIANGDTLYSRDIHVALPGFKVNLEPASKAVDLLLWGNLPEQSSSAVLESVVILHDSKAYDLDFTLMRGRVVLTNTKESGSAKVWLRTEKVAVELVLVQPGTQVALELYGRWPAGVSFHRERKTADEPTQLWEIFVLKGDVQIKAAKTTWAMAAAPGRSYFQGDSVNGPDPGGPQQVKETPDWADPKAKPTKVGILADEVIKEYAGKLKGEEPGAVAQAFFALSLKDKIAERGAMVRQIVVTTLAALDEVDKVVDLLETSPNHDARKAAVIGLRHWIGAREGRDDKLHDLLIENRHYTKVEADVILNLLHSPFDPNVAETYDTLIAYLKHRKQAVRELSHWHLTRLAPLGRDIPYDAHGPAEERAKAADAWRKLELPPKK